MTKGFAIIAALDQDRGIGKNGTMPWQLSADLKHFKEITTAHAGSPLNVVIMGRKTWESIPEQFRPLPGRHNVVITSQQDYPLPGNVEKVGSLDAAISKFCHASSDASGDVFVIGGAGIFSAAIVHPLCTKLYLTEIYDRFDCDAFFPGIPSCFIETQRSPRLQENKKMFSFLSLTKG